MIKIGVFDSGVGGLSVVNAIHKARPDLKIIYADDKKHVPYGNRKISEIKKFVVPILTELENQGCQAIVVACNTVTTNLITELRQTLQVPLIGMEPMIKPAANLTKSKIITICATPLTLSSVRYKWLKNQFAKDIKVFEPDCSDWSYMIQTNQIDRQQISKMIDSSCNAGSDVIVLGCTHYHWIEQIIKDITGQRAIVIQPEAPVIRQLNQILTKEIKVV